MTECIAESYTTLLNPAALISSKPVKQVSRHVTAVRTDSTAGAEAYMHHAPPKGSKAFNRCEHISTVWQPTRPAGPGTVASMWLDIDRKAEAVMTACERAIRDAEVLHASLEPSWDGG